MERRYNIKQLIPAFLDAAKREDWDSVDQQLIPQLAGVNNIAVGREMLGYVGDENPNVRDVVATVLGSLNLDTDPMVKQLAIQDMMVMATEDAEKFPAGRAAMFLYKHRDDREYGRKIRTALGGFTRRVGDEGWREELIQNISGFDKVLADA